MTTEGGFGAHQGFQDSGEGSSTRPPPQPETIAEAHPLAQNFDIFDWHQAYVSCQKFFVDHAQYEQSCQAVAALLNIKLPFQWTTNPVSKYVDTAAPQSPAAAFRAPVASPDRQESASPRQQAPYFVSLIPYIRRFVITGFDTEPIFHGFFGDDWRKGVIPLHLCERRNFLFAAKSGGWGKVKAQYDIDATQTVPWMQAPRDIREEEIVNAEHTWSSWLALEDWMVGPRAPEVGIEGEDPATIEREGGMRE